MAINLKRETERLIQEEIQNGHFQSVDDLIVKTVHAWREKRNPSITDAQQRRQAVERALAFARNRAVPLGGVSIKELIHEGHRL